MLKLDSVFMDDMHPSWRVDEAPTLHDILILVIRGSLTYYLEGNAVTLEKGDFLYIPYGTLRSGVNGPNGPHQKYSAHFRITNPEQFPLPNPNIFYKAKIRNLDYLSQRFAILAQQWLGRLPHYDTICHGIVQEMLGHMSREGEMKIYSTAKLNLVKDVQHYLIEHFRDSVSIAELAELLGRSPNYITHTYKEVTGLTPIAYVHHLRIQAARDLILSSQITIGEVSDFLGYSDQSHFNRMFKKMMGYPPSAIRHTAP